MSRVAASLKEVVEDCDSGQMATVKKTLLAGAATLAKATKQCGIRGQVWWVKSDEKRLKTLKEVSVVEEGSGDPEVALPYWYRYTKIHCLGRRDVLDRARVV